MLSRREVFRIMAAGSVLMVKPSRLWASVSPSAEAALRDADVVYIATQRKNGERSTARPVWFYYDNGKIFFTTAPTSWKAKRISRGSPLYMWVGSEKGPFLTGRAEAVADPAYVDRMGEAYADKYWIAWLGLFRPRSSRVTEGKTRAYVVTLSEGDASALG